MKVVRLKISNFRSIKSAELHFDGHTLIVGPNNVGKSTICEALDLVLGPDRISKFPPVEEFDFHNAQYLAPSAVDGEEPTSVPIHIEVVLTDINAEIENRCGQHLEFWHSAEKRLLGEGEADAANPPLVVSCLRLETLAEYNPEEDEFEAKTLYSRSPNAEPGELDKVSKDVKRLFGFLYLRAVRTGSRALSLERGSLLDVILRLRGSRAGLWEQAIERLRGLDIEKDATHLQPVLESIEARLGRYIASDVDGRTTKLYVSQLTREHLRKTMAFFLAMSKDQTPVPFQQVGTGTLNVLVLALLSFIAELKPASVIFAMEEPEIAVPPHTQRRIADYLLHNTTQAFATSHSPYVIERFEPGQTLLLSRGPDSSVAAKKVSDAGGLKGNDFKRFARRGLTECMLGKGTIVVEGLTEFHALPVAARKMEENDASLQPLDIAGTAFFDSESESAMTKFGTFFKALGLKTFSFYDFIARSPEKKKLFTDAFDVDCEHAHAGFEMLVVNEMSVDRLWTFLDDLRASGDNGNFAIPIARPTDAEVKKLTASALKNSKGAGWAARLFEGSTVNELPATVTGFLKQVYAAFPKPADIPVEVVAGAVAAKPAEAGIVGTVLPPAATT
ncbi:MULTISPECIES: ATP-dependent nuclease [Paraburkholderia]|uniref:ATP-dependent nuclease n=1 Tax=Paraburkholderia TaxID=1822464 RepID=UPI00054F621A|nr:MULTISPECIES: AAA family ATPase [Paraburkholderia]MDH6152623.1 putative ATP-dependent endonuclease of OLD family [Paraburkholderia sp. WSM4179]